MLSVGLKAWHSAVGNAQDEAALIFFGLVLQ